MKRKLLVTLAILAFSVSAFAIDYTLDVKGGAQRPTDVKKTGFDSAAILNIGVDKYFTVGPEVGFGWINWEQKTGSVVIGNQTLTKNSEINLYSLPVLGVAKIRLADMMESYGFMPYITGGAGYSWTWYKLPSYTHRFGGFTWQAMGGVEVKLGSDSNLALLVEGGYRGAKVKHDGLTLKMSGPVGRVGISFPLGGNED